MGLFTSSTPSAGATPNANGIAPTRTQRAKCWEGRDAFFACLDAHNIVDPLKPGDKETASKVCAAQERQFEGACVASWVEYFKKRRVMEINREAMLAKLKTEGARQVEMPQPVGRGQTET
ncbi:cytochrome oxidase c subunit VIb-domain-containing protein [Geopyxis carbonaria]|nr:cytochrome oxidase c subunit VIb-domain-containing protein [Geopyxis carbonaria]